MQLSATIGLSLLLCGTLSAEGWKTFSGDPYSTPSRILTLTHPTAINERGAVTGYFANDAETQAVGFLRQPGGSLRLIEIPGTTLVRPLAMNSGGVITGAADGRGFVREPDGDLTFIDIPGGFLVTPRAITSSGIIVGDFWEGTFWSPGNRNNLGFIRSREGRITTFSALPFGHLSAVLGVSSNGEAMGVYDDKFCFLRSKKGELSTCNVGSNGRPASINESGTIAGTADLGGPTAYLRSGNGKVNYFDVPGTLVFPSGLAQNGTLGGSFRAGAELRGFVRSSNGSLDVLDYSGGLGTSVTDVNTRGDATGEIFLTGKRLGFVYSKSRED